MTSYEFEKVAKNAVIKALREKLGFDLSVEELQFVWFAHILGYKKCTVYAPRMGKFYAEVTYNRDKDEMYIDVYEKQDNTVIRSDEFDYEAKSVQKKSAYNIGDIIEFTMTDGEHIEAMAVKEEADVTTFIFVDCLKKEYPLIKDGDYSGGYEKSYLRKALNNDIVQRFPESIRKHMVPFSSGDMLRIPTEREIFGENPYGIIEGDDIEQFKPMRKRRNRIAFQGLNGDPEWYWLQNPVRSVRSATAACYVHFAGYADNYSASSSLGVRPLFQYR